MPKMTIHDMILFGHLSVILVIGVDEIYAQGVSREEALKIERRCEEAYVEQVVNTIEECKTYIANGLNPDGSLKSIFKISIEIA